MPSLPEKVRGLNGSHVPKSDAPDYLRPYVFHGLDLTVRGSHAVGDCPFCGKANKFSVSTTSGQWRCFVCGTGTVAGGGNAIIFLRLLWERSISTCVSREQLASERGFLDPTTVTEWGVCRSIIDKTWLVPGYGINGELNQLYRRQRMIDKGKWTYRLLPTPGVWPEGRSHALHMAKSSFNPARPNVWLFEGPWDGMALWETARRTKLEDDGKLVLTGSESSSIIADGNVIAVPGCWGLSDHWLPLFKDKDVTIWYDSDHPRVENGKTFRAGFDGTFRVAKKLSGIARSVRWLRWGQDGYDPSKPSGYDVRDHLKSAQDRREAIRELIERIEVAPADWFNQLAPSVNGHSFHQIESLQCESWNMLEGAWRDAQEWRQVIGDVLSVMLAVTTSTLQGGNQLFLQLIGAPSSGKSVLCEGLLVSRNCHALDSLTGFHSGFKKPGEPEKDCSLISRINGKTLVTCEGDVIMALPDFDRVMSQMRRIFDGSSGATYKNTDEDILYTGLRTPWIMAGTPALMDKDQSRLGDRFMRIIMEDPSEDDKRRTSRRAFRNEMDAMVETSNGTASSILNPRMKRAYSYTGGYVDWLRANVERLLSCINVSTEAEDFCIDLATIAADMRARPNYDTKKHETHDSKEMPYRLAAQFGRLAKCLAAVRNLSEIDKEVLRIVRKVALDTAHGHTQNIVRWFCSPNPKLSDDREYQDSGMTIESLAMFLDMTVEKATTYMLFLRKIDVCFYEPPPRGRRDGVWRLTQRVYDLYNAVVR